MRDAVKFFLDRMETNPDEFVQDRVGGVKHNWISEINSYKKYFSTEEHEALFTKLANINLGKLKERIAYKLLESEKEEQEELSQQSLQEAINKIQAMRQQQDLEEKATKFYLSQQQYEALEALQKEGKL
jgi:hypothetical protein